jgi:hypothetical protein
VVVMVESVEVGKYYKMISNNSGIPNSLFKWLETPQQVKWVGREYTDYIAAKRYIMGIIFEHNPTSCGYCIYLEDLEEVKNIKIKNLKISPIKYMVYGEGCRNKSELLDSRGVAEKTALELKQNPGWTGTIKGYKLIPIFEVETKTTIKKIGLKRVRI